jgi:hydrogenase large subunit
VSLNRVEGDLEIRAEISDGIVTDAWCISTMYRGFETILLGRSALDALVITPRICGICSTSHLTAAALALDRIADIEIPQDGLRVRNVVQMIEHLQSDLRHYSLMFATDFIHAVYQNQSLFNEVTRRYAPFKGHTSLMVIQETKRLIEVAAILGGQWPHSAFMVPGGIASVPSSADFLQCRQLIQHFRTWYERHILGCSLERWRELKNYKDLETWLDESPSHRNSEVGFFLQFGRAIGLDQMGRGHNNFLSYGCFQLPTNLKSAQSAQAQYLIPSGIVQGQSKLEFEPLKIGEHVAVSWYIDYPESRHPAQGGTQPYATGRESTKYSWTKAPRYNGLPAETGPLAEALISSNPLFMDLVCRGGSNTLVRELARLVRATTLLPAMEQWLTESLGDGRFYQHPGEIIHGEGFGLTHGGRGALGHWVHLWQGKIDHYQIVTPTTWNTSPRDSQGVRGPLEEALIGTPIKDPDNPVEIGHVVRSFDPCLACTVHTITKGKPSSSSGLRVDWKTDLSKQSS